MGVIWVCLKMGYTPNYSHLVGIMISKTIGCRGTLFSDKPIYSCLYFFNGCIANQSSYNVQHPCCLIFLMEHGDLSIIKHENLKLIHDDWLIVGVSLPFECSGWSQSMNWDWPWLKWERHWNIMGYNGISMAAPLGNAQLVELVVTV